MDGMSRELAIELCCQGLGFAAMKHVETTKALSFGWRSSDVLKEHADDVAGSIEGYRRW